MRVGERAENLTRVFNFREGCTAQDGNMPQRFFIPYGSGPLEMVLEQEAFQNAKDTYYEMIGWPNGLP